MIFKLMSPQEQFLSYMDSYQRQHRELPTSCYLSRSTLTALITSCGGYAPQDHDVCHLFGVALHIQEDK